MCQALRSTLESFAYETKLPDESPVRVIATLELIKIAEQAKLTGREVEIAALQVDIVPDRYLRNLRSLTLAEQRKLLQSTVCVVGLGGLGGLVTETLARMGIGRLRLIDGDRFEAHNLNRQSLCGVEHLGRPKAESAANRVKQINPGLDVKATEGFLTNDNADELIRSCDLVVDCLDNIPGRFALASASERNRIPMVSAAIAGLTGHITTILPGGGALEAIFGPEYEAKMTKGVETILGCLAPGVTLLASLECAEGLKVLLKKEHTLVEKLLVVDLNDYTFEIIELS
jgi:molybdopterin/thiamine biosynthesis adenylyltransferase